MQLIYVKSLEEIIFFMKIKIREKKRESQINCWHKYMRPKVKPKAIHDPVLAFRDFKRILVR